MSNDSQEKETLKNLKDIVRQVVRDEADELRGEPYVQDRLHEIADGTVPVYTADVFAVAADAPGEVNEAVDEALREFGDGAAGVRGGAEGMLAVAIFMILEREAYEEARKLGLLD